MKIALGTPQSRTRPDPLWVMVLDYALLAAGALLALVGIGALIFGAAYLTHLGWLAAE